MGATPYHKPHSNGDDNTDHKNMSPDPAPDFANSQAALSVVGINILWVDGNGILLSADESLEAILGEPQENLLGSSFVHWFMPEWQTVIATRIAIGHADPTPARHTCQLQLTDGRQPWVLVALIPVRANAPVEEAVFQVILQDLTWQRRAVYTHTTDATRYRDLFEATTDAIAVEHNNRILDVNPAFEHLFGYSHDEIVGKEQLAYIAKEAHFALRQHLQTHHNLPLETVGINKQGTRFPIEVQGKVIDYQGDNVIYVTIRDLREKKAAERAIRERDQMYRTLVGNMPNSAVCLFDPELNILLLDGDLIIRMLDAPPEVRAGWETVTHGSLSAIFPPNHEFILQSQQTLAGEHVRNEYEFGGRIILIDTVPIEAEDGEVRVAMALARDVTAQRQADMQLAASERHMRALLSALPDTLFVLNEQDVFTTYHPGNESILAAQADNVLGETVYTVGLPDEIVSEIMMYRQLALESRDTQAFQCGLDIDGELQHFDARMVALSDTDVLTLIRNITPLKRISDELADHLQRITTLRQIDEEFTQKLGLPYVMTMGLDTTMRQAYANHGFILRTLDSESQTFDFSTIEIAGGYRAKDIEAALADKKSLLSQAIRSERALMRVYEQPDAHSINNEEAVLADTCEQIVVPLYSTEKDRHLLGLLNLETDRPDRFTAERFNFVQLVSSRLAVTLENASLYKQTEEQLEQLRELYEKVTKLEQLKTDMIRIASHDLKNPLMGLDGNLQLLAVDLPTVDLPYESLTVRLEDMQKAVRKMREIVTGILSLEHIEQMAQNSTEKVFNLTDMVRESARDHQTDAHAKQQILVTKMGDSPLYIKADAVQLKEAITNLIGNAIKYTPDEGRVTVNLSGDGDVVTFTVVDNGYGVPEAQQKRLFEPFFRARSEKTKGIEGTGLGLHLVKNIIERHGGEMIFHSVYGEGSTFGFRLPQIAQPNKDVDDFDDLNSMRSMLVG
ncbi:MAG: PAS domain S-box protein [Anaerolineae bacterium]|nr:PAS domain S-box protein [Anaerolineae bacterium]